MNVHNPLSEFDAQPSSRFREALSEADDFIRRADGYDEAQVRVDELTELVRQITELHQPDSPGDPLAHCAECIEVRWPCPTIQLIEGEK